MQVTHNGYKLVLHEFRGQCWQANVGTSTYLLARDDHTMPSATITVAFVEPQRGDDRGGTVSVGQRIDGRHTVFRGG